MPEIRKAEVRDGIWTVWLPGLVVTDLLTDDAEGLIAAFARLARA